MVNTKIELEPPIFTETKLKELLHYTDNPNNPSYEAFKSNAFFKLYCGAKGVSKSFGRMIETVYRLVNEKNFCSVWCRNQYNHIKNTLIPTFQKVLDFLAKEHELDYRPFFEIYNTGAYWTYDDGGKGRALFFQNWEKIQAFQGFTLAQRNFRFGELVIDEPLEDTDENKTLNNEIQQIYKIQKNNLNLLLQNTILRESVEDNFHINVSFLYNIFDTRHFLVQDYHNKVINIIDYDNGKVNSEILNKIIKETFIQEYNADFGDGLGIICTMFSKFFVPRKTISQVQVKFFNQLKEENYKKWLVTVAGFGFLENNDTVNYFLKNLIYEKGKEIRGELLSNQTLTDMIWKLRDHKYVAVADGFDAGIADAPAWVRVALRRDGIIEVLDVVPDLRKQLKQVTRDNINEALLYNISEWNKNWFDAFRSKVVGTVPDPIIFTDNDILVSVLNQLMKDKDITGIAHLAVRKDTKTFKFGIISRQNWEKFIFENNLIKFNLNTTPLLDALARQYILPGEIKRYEEGDKENRNIYNVINAFEMACSFIHAQQMSILSMKERRED